MPEQNIHVLTEVGTLEEAFDALAKLQKTLRYLLNGNLDFENIRAKGIVAETIDVDKLSAIAADLGHITAGLIEAVDIFGSYIATSRSYPRAEMSNTENLYGAYKDANNSIKMHANLTGSPTLTFNSNGALQALLGSVEGIGILFQLMTGSLTIRSLGNLNLISNSGYVTVDNWGKLLNSSNGLTLQEALNLKANNWVGYTGVINTETNRISVQNGIITSVV